MLLRHWPGDGVLAAIAAENMFAETAFVVPGGGGAPDWQLRWFTPGCEVRLCGHATLAAGHVLLERSGEDRVAFRTRRSGTLEVRRAGGKYELALPAIPLEQAAWAEAEAALGETRARQVWRHADGYTVFLYDSAVEVIGLSPDLRALAALGDDQFICTAPGSGHPSGADVVSRVFVPGAGVDEDSVTGSAHAALAPFWAKRLGRARFTAFQASRRGGRVACRIDGERVWLGGGCVTVVSGTFRL